MTYYYSLAQIRKSPAYKRYNGPRYKSQMSLRELNRLFGPKMPKHIVERGRPSSSRTSYYYTPRRRSSTSYYYRRRPSYYYDDDDYYYPRSRYIHIYNNSSAAKKQPSYDMATGATQERIDNSIANNIGKVMYPSANYREKFR